MEVVLAEVEGRESSSSVSEDEAWLFGFEGMFW